MSSNDLVFQIPQPVRTFELIEMSSTPSVWVVRDIYPEGFGSYKDCNKVTVIEATSLSLFELSILDQLARLHVPEPHRDSLLQQIAKAIDGRQNLENKLTALIKAS